MKDYTNNQHLKENIEKDIFIPKQKKRKKYKKNIRKNFCCINFSRCCGKVSLTQERKKKK